MIALEKKYADVAQNIKATIQASDLLSQYLEDEDEDLFKQLQDAFEPQIEELYNNVAEHNPLQLESLETMLLDTEFEGLYLPRILGYSVLRGEVDDQVKFRKPQNHFKDILLTICNSANFDSIKKRIGQTVQVGFSLSSDIWVTNIIDSVDNKKVRAFLLLCKNEKLRDPKARKQYYDNYSMQLEKANFKSVEFPKTAIELKSSFYALRTFIVHRASRDLDNASLMAHLSAFISNSSLYDSNEFLELLIIIGLKYNLDENTTKIYTKAINQIAEKHSNFSADFFNIYDRLFTGKEIAIVPEDEHNLGKLMIDIKDKQIISYFKTTNELHTKGFVDIDAIESVRKYYETHPGMSSENEVLRSSVLSYITKFINNLDPDFYNDFFKINLTVTAYLEIFNNERFSQEVKGVNMAYVAKCIHQFTDKRSKDYQDIKRYVASHFKDMGWLSDKEVVDLFKSRRKKA